MGARLGLPFTLFCDERETADAAVAGGWDEINGNVSPLLPLVVVAATGIGAGVVDMDVELAINVVLLVDRGRVIVTVFMTVV